jgi:hypothetical protein
MFIEKEIKNLQLRLPCRAARYIDNLKETKGAYLLIRQLAQPITRTRMTLH